MARYTFIFGLFFFLTSCSTEEERPLPYVRVDFSIPMSINLAAGTPEKVRQGHVGYNMNGVIIVPEGIAGNVFLAYDATCTRNLEAEASSINVVNDLTATCPRCSTVYHLRTGGFSTDGRSRLQRYRATFQNNRIYVEN